MQQRQDDGVLILGAGINGAAIARDLVLNGVAAHVVDTGDIARGTTARSSRLIHGGLRYLEHGQLGLVRDSLEERARLLRLAPHYVSPLRVFIPVRRRWGGLGGAVGKLLGRPVRPRERGLWIVRLGLALYDLWARDLRLPGHAVHRVGDPAVPDVSARYRWLCAYSDAQMLYPERFVVALLEDARRLAREHETSFEILTYHRIERGPDRAWLVRSLTGEQTRTLLPRVIVNATGPWGDRTLAELGIGGPPLLGGTKGSHFITHDTRLWAALGGQAVYAEAPDGRLVFVLPMAGAVLVGTTDEPFEGDPAQAVPSDQELEYLLSLVRSVFPRVPLDVKDMCLAYSGVRPLPHAPGRTPGSVSRGHGIHLVSVGQTPVLTIVGGKLTTCRSLAEQVTDDVLARLGGTRVGSTRDRVVPGGEGYPASQAERWRMWEQWARDWQLSPAQVQVLWTLFGSRCGEIVGSGGPFDRANLPGTAIPIGAARWMVRHEWVERLEDLVERRLPLLFQPALTPACLVRLAQIMVEEGKLPAESLDEAVAALRQRLWTHYRRRLAE